MNKRTGRANIVDDCKGNKGWRNQVSLYAGLVMGKRPPLEGPIRIEVLFLMPRPADEWRKDGTPRPGAPEFHLKKPDGTKLLRSTEDALTDKRIWFDDAQVVQQVITKRYAGKRGETGAHIKVSQILPAPPPAKMKCISCSDETTPGVDGIVMNEGTDSACIQCAWCHKAEWGTWPTGLAQEE